MTNEKQILDLLYDLDKKVSPLTASANSINDLKEDFAPRVNELMHHLIVELADIEADFQIEHLLHLIKKGLRNVSNFNYSLDQLKNLIDLSQTAEPLLKTTIHQLIQSLDSLQESGLFDLAHLAISTVRKISTTYSTADLEQLFDGLVSLFGMLIKLTTPEALGFLDKAADIPGRLNLSKAKSTGPLAMLTAMGNSEVREGMGVLLELTKGLTLLKAN